MKKNTMGDYPNLPKELKQDSLEEKLNIDVPKRTGLLKKVRHKVKEILNGLTK